MSPDLPAVELAIVEMTNAYRKDRKRAALRRNPLLDKVARNYARYLARTGRFSHTADGREVGGRAKAIGYPYCWIGENLASNLDTRGFETRQLARLAVEGWKGSPGHRKNMLQPLATEIGVGLAKAEGERRYLSVQILGRPVAHRFSFKVRNETTHALSYLYDGKRHAMPPRTIIEHTVCQPGKLSFGAERRKSRRPGLKFDYMTRAGDIYRLQPAGRGRYRVDYRPRTN